MHHQRLTNLMLAFAALLVVDAVLPRPASVAPALLGREDVDHWLSGEAFRTPERDETPVDEPTDGSQDGSKEGLEPATTGDEPIANDGADNSASSTVEAAVESSGDAVVVATPVAAAPPAPTPAEPPSPDAVKPGPIAAAPGTYALPSGADWASVVARARQVASQKSGKFRVVHLGDSEIAGDRLASDLRAALARKIGNGGPGFALAGMPWHWYRRSGFEKIEAIGFTDVSYGRASGKGGNFGPGGTVFVGKAPGAKLKLKVAKPPEGRCALKFLYEPQPGLAFDIVRDGGVPVRVDGTQGETVARWEMPEGPCPKQLEITLKNGVLRAFGWNVEWPGPGVVWSAMGVVGATATHLGFYGPGRLGKSLAALEPDLVVTSFGLNVVAADWKPPQSEGEQLKRLMREVREARPGTACAFMTPYPIILRGMRPSPTTARLAAIVRKAADEAGCLYIDREALAGGPNVALDWIQKKPRMLSGDFIHLTDVGAALVGREVAGILLPALLGGE